MGVQGACLWFIFKDTDWHKDKNGTSSGDAQADFDQPYADPGMEPIAIINLAKVYRKLKLTWYIHFY